MLNSIKIAETPGKLDESESQTVGELELSEPALSTPPLCSTSRPNYFQDCKTTQNSDNARPSSPYECVERDKSLKRDGELHLVKEGNGETSSSNASIAGEQCFRKDEELDVMLEESRQILAKTFSGSKETKRRSYEFFTSFARTGQERMCKAIFMKYWDDQLVS